MSRQQFLDAITRRNTSGQPVFGTGTSIACQGLMEATGAWFPEVRLDAGADRRGSRQFRSLSIGGVTRYRGEIPIAI
jgi:hypothetical protein